jgi:hypothetical protein
MEELSEVLSWVSTNMVVMYIIAFVVSMLIGVFYTTLFYFSSIAIGQLLGEHRIIGSIAAFIGLSIIQQFLYMIYSFFVMIPFMGVNYDDISPTGMANGVLGILWITNLLLLVVSVFFFWITNYVFKRKLNLE